MDFYVMRIVKSELAITGANIEQFVSTSFTAFQMVIV